MIHNGPNITALTYANYNYTIYQQIGYLVAESAINQMRNISNVKVFTVFINT